MSSTKRGTFVVAGSPDPDFNAPCFPPHNDISFPRDIHSQTVIDCFVALILMASRTVSYVNQSLSHMAYVNDGPGYVGVKLQPTSCPSSTMDQKTGPIQQGIKSIITNKYNG